MGVNFGIPETERPPRQESDSAFFGVNLPLLARVRLGTFRLDCRGCYQSAPSNTASHRHFENQPADEDRFSKSLRLTTGRGSGFAVVLGCGGGLNSCRWRQTRSAQWLHLARRRPRQDCSGGWLHLPLRTPGPGRSTRLLHLKSRPRPVVTIVRPGEDAARRWRGQSSVPLRPALGMKGKNRLCKGHFGVIRHQGPPSAALPLGGPETISAVQDDWSSCADHGLHLNAD